jgi:hypothetical protein
LKTLIATLIAAVAAATLVYSLLHNRVNRLQAENQELIAQRDNSPLTQNTALEEPRSTRSLPANPGEIVQLRRETGALRRQTDEMQQTLQAGKASFQAQQLSRQAKEDAADLMLVIRIYTADFGNALALTNLDQFKTLIPGDTNLNLEGFEIVPSPTPWNTNPPESIIVRERTPRPTPDGKWARVYGFADGSVTEQISATGYFDAWEEEHSMPPRSNP